MFCGGFVCEFKIIAGKPNFSGRFDGGGGGYKTLQKVGYNLDIMRLSTCVVNSITGYSYGFLFNNTTVSQALDSMTALT